MFRFIIKTDKIRSLLKTQWKSGISIIDITNEGIRRVLWRNIKMYIETQLTFIEIGLFNSVEEAFLQYKVDTDSGKSLLEQHRQDIVLLCEPK
jgi:hypothetical protein